jgi:GntR family transcriptional repressor for pyruvate dehydrogenase complex
MKDVFLGPLSRSTLASDICRRLMGHVLNGDWKPGDRLPAERDLCRRLGVGRTSLREALKALEVLGIIESRRGGGTFVAAGGSTLAKPFSWVVAGASMDIQEVYEARRAVESEQAMLAATRATAEELAEIEACVKAMDAAVENPGAFSRADLAFHLAVGRASHNRLLINVSALLGSLMGEWLREAALVFGLPQSAAFHRRIFEALRDRQPELARALACEHLDIARRGLHRARGAAMSAT